MVIKTMPVITGFIYLCSLFHKHMDKLFAVEVNRGSHWGSTTYAPRSLENAIILRNAMKRDFSSYKYRVVSIVPKDYYATID